MPISLPVLPYEKNTLAPYISQQTIEYHYGKHHNAYVTNTNKLIEGTDLSNQDLGNIIKKTSKDTSMSSIFNNAAQVWNHSFYWACMKPGGGGSPSGAIAERIASDFGSYEKFAEQFKNAGTTQFGSGWAWLILKDNHLEIMKTSNADTPLAHGLKPLLTVDVWEHAYYLDYQNRRPDYLASFLEHLINWDFVNSLI
ncbi:MAG: superoxide dismutase [Proteobacteria bacterium]|nr:superoxide dismutase [Pseudomonadota bacterium]MBU4014323.1 superoxide dismutase [Pseudomonadota bacterium]MBU4067290.1 superoxide dismutase [Pseudomonadota bacterium]MBU4128180.1 superoxide dismutase [Pseudomonadota bacterium]MBU4504649.1 superoxide dismutase [Pseudomonadota bacterium]